MLCVRVCDCACVGVCVRVWVGACARMYVLNANHCISLQLQITPKQFLLLLFVSCTDQFICTRIQCTPKQYKIEI